LNFYTPDTKIFRNLALAFETLEKGGNLACMLNAANEVVVSAFLKGELGFLQMPEVIEKTMNKISFVEHPSIDDYIATDREARQKAVEIINVFKN